MFILNSPFHISIHALRVEGDMAQNRNSILASVISIHALRVEGDALCTPSTKDNVYFYPRPPGGGRLNIKVRLTLTSCISIHALRVEGDSIDKIMTL